MIRSYQYKVVKDVPPIDLSEDMLNTHGANGWKLVSTKDISGALYLIFIKE